MQSLLQSLILQAAHSASQSYCLRGTLVMFACQPADRGNRRRGAAEAALMISSRAHQPAAPFIRRQFAPFICCNSRHAGNPAP